MKKTLSLALLIISIHTGFAQDQNEETKKQLANAFKILEAKEARFGSFSIAGDYIMVDGKITGQHYISSTYCLTYIPGNVYTAIYYPDPSYPRVIVKDGNCTPQHVDLYNYVTTSTGPNTTRIVQKGFAINGDGNKVSTFYNIEYGANNRIKAVNEGYIVLNKKSNKPMFEYITSESTFTWKNDNDATAITSTYYDKRKEKDDRILITSHTIHHTVELNKVESTDESGRTIQSITTGNETTLKSKEKDGNFRLANKIITEGGKVVKTEYYSYDNQTGVLKSKTISDYTYEKASSSDPSDPDICTFTMKSSSSIYDAQGNLIEERRIDGKFRQKRADGSWGEWTSFRL